MKRDPYNHKKRWENWKNKVKNGIPDITIENSDLILRYLSDMEMGMNVSSKSVKGCRAPNRLNTLKDRMIIFAKHFEAEFKIKSLSEIREEHLHKFFSDMRNGVIKNRKGKDYKSLDTLGKIFKAFWNWHIKVNRKYGKNIENIAVDLDIRSEKPKWVYLNEDQTKRLLNQAKFEYKALISFLLDTGIRSPSELINVKVSDLSKDYMKLNIREEIVKKRSHGRRINIMFCSDIIKEFIESKNLNEEDYLFDIKPNTVNKYLKTLSKKLFGDKISLAGERYSDLSMYDFRHISCCFWLPRYPTESGLKYRFGWKKSDKIHYYSELLGMKDTISEGDLLISTTKTELEKRVNILEREKDMLKEKIIYLENHMETISKLTESIQNKLNGTNKTTRELYINQAQ